MKRPTPCLWFLLLAWCLLVSGAAATETLQPIFNGTNLQGWKIISQPTPPNLSKESLVTVHDGVMHMYQDVPAGHRVPFGVVLSERSYARFQITFEYRWLEKRFAPRANMLRDGGFLYHCYRTHEIWPDCVECQVQEGDTGDIVLLNSRAKVFLNPRPDTAPEGQGEPGLLPELGGVALTSSKRNFYVGRLPEVDRLQGWNTVEVIVHGSDYALHKVNGQLVARLYDMKTPAGEPLGEGPIAFQFEAAELQYRRIMLRELPEPLRPEERHLSFQANADGTFEPVQVTITNPAKVAIGFSVQTLGAHPQAFQATSAELAQLGPGESTTITVAFSPTSQAVTDYAAGLQIGDEATGCFLTLRGKQE